MSTPYISRRSDGNKLLLLGVNSCHLRPMNTCVSCSRQGVPVEEDSGADDELEDVLQSLHGLQKLFRQLFSVIHVVLQDFGEFSEKHTVGPTNLLMTWNHL